MTDSVAYYSENLTELPYKTILGADSGMPFARRVWVAFRKMTGLRGIPPNGRATSVNRNLLEIADLPPSLRASFTSRTRELEAQGFESVMLSKTDTVGAWAQYTSVLCSGDRTTLAILSAARLWDGLSRREAHASVFRTDLQDGTVLTTGISPPLPPYLIRPRRLVETFPETTPVPEILAHHRDRLIGIVPVRITPIPEVDTIDFLRDLFNDDLQELFAPPSPFRRLTDTEVERLRRVSFDFN